MLICLFKFEDIGPSLVFTVSDKNMSFDESIRDKFRFAGTVTFSLVYQGVLSLEDVALELYGPMPFAFANEFVQFAFSFLVDDPSITDKRMRNKTLGLLLMLVPEKVGKIDDFREELEKMLIYKFRNITNIKEVTKELLTEMIEEYNKIVTNLLNIQQAESLSEEIFTILKEKKISLKRNICTIYSRSTSQLINSFYGSFLNSIPFESTMFTHEGYGEIISSTFEIYFFKNNNYQQEKIKNCNTLILIVDIEHDKSKDIHAILDEIKGADKKIGFVIKLPNDIEKGSKLYANFMLDIHSTISDNPFFSATFHSLSELRHKFMEAFLWALSI